MEYFYRAVNEHELDNLSNFAGYMCNLVIHKNDTSKTLEKYEKIRKELATGDFSLIIDRIIGHINGQGLCSSLWISTSKDFNYVIREYAIPQNGKYNIDDYRKEVILIQSSDEIDLEKSRDSRDFNSFVGKFIDISNHKLRDYNQRNLILPYSQNEKADVSLSQSIKTLEIDENNNLVPKKNITGFDNFAYSANEVLFFYKINQEDVILKLDPLMQDIIYAYTHNKTIEETNRLIKEIYDNYHDKDFTRLLSNEELNLYNYLYNPHNNKYNSLITLVKLTFLNDKDIQQSYEVTNYQKSSHFSKFF